MTQPSNAQQREGGGRVYVWPPHPPYELEVPSVTTIINGGRPKPALIPWAALVTARYAVEHVEAWLGLPAEDAIDLIKREPHRARDKRGDVGSEVHQVLDHYAKGEPIHVENLSQEVRGFCRGAARFMVDNQAKIMHAEATIYSRKHQYAGTPDLIATVELREWDKPQLCIIDYKTSKDIYNDMGLQLAAYSRGEFIAGPNDEEIQMPEVRTGIVVQLAADGVYAYKVFDLADKLFQSFLHTQGVYGSDLVMREFSHRKVTVKAPA